MASAIRTLTNHWFTLFFVAISLTLPFASQAALPGSLFGSSQMEFLPVDDALPFNFTTEGNNLVLTWNVAPGHYLYKDRITIQPDNDQVRMGSPAFSRSGTVTEDDYFGEVTVFYDPVTATLPVELPDHLTETTFQVTYQGCAEAGLCYPPQTREALFFPANSEPSPNVAADTARSLPQDTETAAGLAGFLADRSILAIAGVFLALGLGLTFTPCVLPMVPIISALVSSRNTQTTAHALLLSASYVLGMALTYALAGVITGLLGASFNLQAQLQSPWVLSGFAALFIAFALSMFNLYDLQLPRFIRDRLNQASHKLTGGRVASLFAIGAISSLIVSPCVSAPLAGSLLYISTTQDAVVGGVALFALGLGMGLPLILVAVGGRRFLPASGQWMNVVKSIYGIMLLGVAIWLIERLVADWAALILWGVLAAVTGVQLGAFDTARAGWQRTWKGLGLVLFAYGLALLAGAMTGANDPLKPLAPFTMQTATPAGQPQDDPQFLRLSSPEQLRSELRRASTQGRPVMLDFYADWCISCKIMEREVFTAPDVRQALAPYTLLQLDLTDNTPAQQALLNEWGLFGPPAILFFRRDGNEAATLRVLGEMSHAEFLGHLAKASALNTSRPAG
ncbi:protein-disulfide reductase DsbD [Marinobacter sp. SS21]|uniref:protein-disulfide reductase DsbD n=1 Tax=Marinobacter sp. SS21 TaxID=2979460 RepID=UPI00232E06C2|nr:protein-disulfide reductase DsbD [Marinobacter sp. SS21]MDC0662050.1 protein-disulfide reductase DsbD [Marinobacter sp. SS21]